MLVSVTVLVASDEGLLAVRDGAPPASELADRVTALRVDATLGSCAVVVDGAALARRTEGGSWAVEPVALAAPITAVLATGRGALVGTADARLARVVEGGVEPLPGFDRLDGRDHWHAVGSRTPYVRSLSATATGGTLLASVHVGGVPRSADQGATWAPTVDIEADVHEVRAHPVEPEVVMAAAAVGLLESRDEGATWAPPATTGLHATYLRALAFPTGAVVVSASDGPFGRRPALYRRALDGGPFERCTDGLPEWLPAIVDTGALDARGDLVVAGTADTVYASEDGGDTWRLLADALPPIRGVAIADPPAG
jgi:hypothetical protein